MTARRFLHDEADVAAAVAENPPDIPGWENVVAMTSTLPPAVTFGYEDDEGAESWFTLTVTRVELDERRVKPDPPEREKGDTDL
jgi:hypothetical protein